MHAKFQAARFYSFGVMEETHTHTAQNDRSKSSHHLKAFTPEQGSAFLWAPIMVPFLVAMFLRPDALPDANPSVAFDTQG